MSIIISVVVPTWKRVSILKDVIDSLVTQNYPKQLFEVIICDSQSEDGTIELVKSYQNNHSDFNIRLINSEINAQSVKRNDGAIAAQGGILIFLDDDVVPSKNLLIEYFNAHQNSNNIVFLGLSLFSNKRVKKSNLLKYRNNRTKRILIFNDNIPPENFVSMNFSIKKNDFFKIGMFDPTFTNYGGEDHDFPIRMGAMGFRSKLCKGAISEHREPSSNLYGRMKKIFISASKGFVPLKDKFPSFFTNSTIGLLEENDIEDSRIRIIKKTLIKYLLRNQLIKIITHFLVWSDNYRLLYQPFLYKIVLAYAYIEGVNKRFSHDDIAPSFENWKIWDMYNQD